MESLGCLFDGGGGGETVRDGRENERYFGTLSSIFF